MNAWEQLDGALDGSRSDQLGGPARRRPKQPFLKRGEGVQLRLTAYQRRKPPSYNDEPNEAAESPQSARQPHVHGSRVDQWSTPIAVPPGSDRALDADAPPRSSAEKPGGYRWGASRSPTSGMRGEQQQQQRLHGGADDDRVDRGRSHNPSPSSPNDSSELQGETLMVHYQQQQGRHRHQQQHDHDQQRDYYQGEQPHDYRPGSSTPDAGGGISDTGSGSKATSLRTGSITCNVRSRTDGTIVAVDAAGTKWCFARLHCFHSNCAPFGGY